jgi:RNA polymerase sigma factor (TIGR02999 family)
MTRTTGIGDVTLLLERWREGDRNALDVLAPIVESELRQIANGYMRRERNGHTLQPTALVNEAWLRLVKNGQPDFANRKHFYAMAAKVMRNILVDYARAARCGKRDGARVTLDDSCSAQAAGFDQFLALDQALEQLARVSPRQAHIIELRYFGGLEGVEIASLLGLSNATISREQTSAEAWLGRFVKMTPSRAREHEVDACRAREQAVGKI